MFGRWWRHAGVWAAEHRRWGIGGCALAAARQQGLCRFVLGWARWRGDEVKALAVGHWQGGSIVKAFAPEGPNNQHEVEGARERRSRQGAGGGILFVIIGCLPKFT